MIADVSTPSQQIFCHRLDPSLLHHSDLLEGPVVVFLQKNIAALNGDKTFVEQEKAMLGEKIVKTVTFFFFFLKFLSVGKKNLSFSFLKNPHNLVAFFLEKHKQ